MRAVVPCWALGTLGFALLIHVVWWRVRRPSADIGAMLGLFVLFPCVVDGTMAAAGALGASTPLTPLESAAALVLNIALSGAYLWTYPASQAQSPTLYILLAVGRAPDGLDRAGIVAALRAAGLVGDRIEDLLRNALVQREGDRIVLRPGGKALARVFTAYRRWLGIENLGG